MEKEMATHSSVLAWRIPGTGKPVGLPSMWVAQSRTGLKRLSSSSSRGSHTAGDPGHSGNTPEAGTKKLIERWVYRLIVL